MGNTPNIAVIGGGAAGFFGAVTAANAGATVTLFEKTNKLLAKVKVSGGGRCNVTHHCFNANELAKHYPRGGKELKKAFYEFQAEDTVNWYESRGVKLKAEADGRMFPVTDDSQTIIDCLMREIKKTGVKIITGAGITKLEPTEKGILLHFNDGTKSAFDKVLIATGGSPKLEGFNWLKELGHTIEPPVPSLFTFNIPHSKLDGLMGTSKAETEVKIIGTKLSYQGPTLITHWGISGPAVLKLSAWGARILHDTDYKFTASINWTPEHNEDSLREYLIDYKSSNQQKQVFKHTLLNIPNRLWVRLCEIAEIKEPTRWADLPKKNLNKLVNEIVNCQLAAHGKTTFKEEFVTCGGVSLNDINFKTMESKVVTNLYFAGEVLDIDGITGGFNFQAAWTTGYLAGKAINS